MIAKLIVHGKDRYEAIAKLKQALEEMVVEGVETNIDFLLHLIQNDKFKAGDYDTSLIEKEVNI